MAVFGHGSDLLLAPTLGPLVRDAGCPVRTAIERIAKAGFDAVQLDASLAGIRPRELDRRARLDLLALLKRRGLRLAGWDLFIPRRHFTEADLIDRAMGAMLAAIELAADTGQVPLALTLPIAAVHESLRRQLVEAADTHGVRLAVHAEDQLEDMSRWLSEADTAALGVGVDAATAIALKADPATLVHHFARRLTAARLSDAAGGGGERCRVGEGELDVPDFRVAVDLAPARLGPVVLDLRGLASPLTAAAAAKRAWDRAGFSV